MCSRAGTVPGGGRRRLGHNGFVEFVLVRHGQPEWVRDGLNVVDPPLTELGLTQAELMGQAVHRERFDEVLVSPLHRARQTAAPWYRALRARRDVEPWLEEIRDPGWHGTPAEKAAQAYREMRERPVDARWDGLIGGEPIRDFTERIRAGATEFLAERGVVRTDHDLPIWSIADPGAASGSWPTPAPTRSSSASSSDSSRRRGSGTGSCSVMHRSAGSKRLRVHDGFTFSLTSLSNQEHLAAAQRSR